MSSRDIIEASKHGPELALSVICTSIFLFALNYLGVLSGLQTTLLFFPLAAGLWFVFGRYLHKATILNAKWLKIARQIHPEIVVKPSDFKREREHTEFLLNVILTNSGYKDIEKYRILFWIPRRLLPAGTHYGSEDKSRSTGSDLCLRLPHPDAKTVEPIIDGQSKRINIHLVLRDNEVNMDLLNSRIRVSIIVDGLLILDLSEPIGSFVQTESVNGIRVSGMKAA